MNKIRNIRMGNTTTGQISDFPDNTWTTYSLFGLTLQSNFKLTKRVAISGEGNSDVTFTRELVDSLDVDRWQGISPNYISPFKTKNGESLLHAFHRPDSDVLHFPDTADFYISADRILCHQLHQTMDYEIERWLVGIVLSFWLERKGIPVLHASSVVIEGKAVGFLATNFAGKSSLAATLMECGYPLLTDDVLALECSDSQCIGRPGYPRMRLWPDQARHFFGPQYEDLERIHPDASKRNVPIGPDGIGTFCDKSMPVGCIYIPQRKDQHEKRNTVEVLPVSRRDAFIELVRYSLASRILTKFGLQEERMQSLMQIALQVPIRRLQYPSGLELLPGVREAIVEDVISLSKESCNGKRNFVVNV